MSSPKEKKRLLIHRCASDVELYALVFFSHYCTRPFNAFHKELLSGIKYGEKNIRRASAAPRGNAKSTLATLIKPLHDVCYGLEKFILILSSTTPLANKKLKDIRNEIRTNRLLNDFYGVRFPTKKVGESEFTVVTDDGECYFAALGKGSEVRGIRINEHRPTKIIADDVEYSEEVYNEQVRKKTENWFFEDVTKAGDTGTNIEFVGTILHRESLLAKLLNNPAYSGRAFRAIISWSEREDLWEKWREIYRNKDNPNREKEALAFYESNKSEMLKGTKVLWPEKETYLDHMKDIEEIGLRAFMKEKQNDPQGSEDRIFEKFWWYKEISEGIQIRQNGAIIRWEELKRNVVAAVDPATGKTKPKSNSMGDFTAIGVGFKDLKGRLFVHHDFTKRVSPTRGIEEIFNLHERFSFDKMAIETNLYRNLLLPNIIQEKKIREERTKKKIEISFYDVEQTENKRERIFRIEPKVNHGWILFNEALSQEFKNQFIDFPYAAHDDAPDMVEMLWNLVNNRYRPSGLSNVGVWNF